MVVAVVTSRPMLAMASHATAITIVCAREMLSIRYPEDLRVVQEGTHRRETPVASQMDSFSISYLDETSMMSTDARQNAVSSPMQNNPCSTVLAKEYMTGIQSTRIALIVVGRTTQLLSKPIHQ